MPVTPNDFLLSAEELIKGNREIDFRNSASRAYYSCYLECRSFADGLPEAPESKSGSHGKVIEKFTEHLIKEESKDYDKAIKSIGHMLNQVRTLRTMADYYIDESYSKNDAETAIGTVEKINSKIQSL